MHKDLNMLRVCPNGNAFMKLKYYCNACITKHICSLVSGVNIATVLFHTETECLCWKEKAAALARLAKGASIKCGASTCDFLTWFTLCCSR